MSDLSGEEIWRRGSQAAARLLDACPAEAHQGDADVMTPWAQMLIAEYEWLYVVYLEWARVLAYRPVPAQVSAPLRQEAEGAVWAATLYALLDAASDADDDKVRAAVRGAESLDVNAQVNFAYALAVRAKLMADACGGRERLEEIAVLVAAAGAAGRVPGETRIAEGSAALMLGMIAAGDEAGAQHLHTEVLYYHPERSGPLALLLAAVVASLGRIGYAMRRDADGLPSSLRELRAEPDDSDDADSVLTGVARDLADGIRDGDPVALSAVLLRMAGLADADRIALGWQLAQAAGTRIGQKYATKEHP